MNQAISGENTVGFDGLGEGKRKKKEKERKKGRKEGRKERRGRGKKMEKKMDDTNEDETKEGEEGRVNNIRFGLSFFLFTRKIIREPARALWPKNALSTLHVSSVRAGAARIDKSP